MSTESLSDIIPTATVAIFSPDMKRLILIVNKKLSMILPPGWKREEGDSDIFATAVREVFEEIWLNLLDTKWSFLNENGRDSFLPAIIWQEYFPFHDLQKQGFNSLYFFRLAEELPDTDLKGELQWFYYTKNQILQESVLIWGRKYDILDPNTKAKIVAVMKE